ncbi:SWR1 complex [Salix suchowensis]|nr:SWR1 complex [Salix suchowensis]
MSMRTRKIAPRMATALASNDNRTQPPIARLEALENDYTGMEIVEAVDDDKASLDDDDDGITVSHSFLSFVHIVLKYSLITIAIYIQKKQKGTKRKTRQTKALENANLEALPPHVPSYMRAAMGPPCSTWHFYTVCGFTSNYTYAKCGMPFVQSDARKYMMIPVA